MINYLNKQLLREFLSIIFLIISVSTILALAADFSFGITGLTMFCPVSAMISVFGSGLFLIATYIVLLFQLIRFQLSMKKKLLTIVVTFCSLIMINILEYKYIQNISAPINYKYAVEVLVRGLSQKQKIYFDSHLSQQDRDKILASTSNDWRLVFCSSRTGYDFVLIDSISDHTLGLRVITPTLLKREGNLSAYEETTFNSNYFSSSKYLPIEHCGM